MGEVMPMYSNDDAMTTIFLFNHIIARFIVPKKNDMEHDSHFKNFMMSELSSF